MTRLLIVLALVGAVAGSAWLLGQIDEGEGPRVARQSHDPDYYLEDFTQAAMGHDGAPLRRLAAASLVHYPDDDSSELVRPRLELYNEGPRPWHVVAERGWVSAGNEVLLLYGEVEIWRDDADGGRELELRTRDLRILPEEQYAESDHPTVIRTRNTVINATGLRADFGKRRLELVTRVRSRHDVADDS